MAINHWKEKQSLSPNFVLQIYINLAVVNGSIMQDTKLACPQQDNNNIKKNVPAVSTWVDPFTLTGKPACLRLSALVNWGQW